MYRVLLVDDEPLIRKGLRQTVEWDELGLEIAGEAADGEEALLLVQSLKPQIVITDIKMPGMDGLAFIRELKRRGLEQRVIILSGYSDYHLLKEAIQLGVDGYLLKPIDNDELAALLTNTAATIERDIFTAIREREGLLALENNTLNRVVTKQIAFKEFKEKAAMLQLAGWPAFPLRVSVIGCDPHGEDQLSRQPQLKAFALLNIAQEIVGAAQAGVVFLDGAARIVLIGGPQPEERLAAIADSVMKYLRYTLHIGIGREAETFDEIPDAYETALRAMEYGMLIQAGRPVGAAELPEASSDPDRRLLVDVTRVEQAVIEGQADRLVGYIDSLFHQGAGFAASVDELRDLVMQFIVAILRTVEKSAGDFQSAASLLDFRYSDLLAMQRLPELRRWAAQFGERAVELLNHQLKRKVSQTVEQVLAYIAEHYDEDLSLKLIAQRIPINASYLGQLFSRETGVSFTDYVNRHRIERANQLLLGTSLRVYEIAEKVGFTDAHYFTKIYKKYTGRNPTDLKRRE